MSGLLTRLRLFWRGVRRPTQLDVDMNDEMRFHLDMEAERLRACGLHTQQDDANLGKLLGNRRVRDEPRRIGADHDAGEEISNNRRESRSLSQVPEEQRGCESSSQRQDQIERVHLP
jgi:hypothetical protein